MKFLRPLVLPGGLLGLALALGFIFQVPFVTQIFWPWPDGRYSYLFIGSILAAASVAAIWIGWTGTWGALPAGSLNIIVIAATTSIYIFQLALQGRSDLLPFGVVAVLLAVGSALSFLWSRRVPLSDPRSTPVLVKVSFGIFIFSLVLAGGALLLKAPIFPWTLNPDSSVIFGCIFIGDAFYFLHGLLYPRWQNAAGQLLSFLAYDLVLIVPFLSLFKTVGTEHLFSLVAYVAVLLYSGVLAVYFLFMNPSTRFGS